MILTSLLALCGQFFGSFLAFNSPEEFQFSRRYYTLFMYFTLLCLIIYLAWHFFSLIGFVIGLIAGFLMKREYLYFGLILASPLSVEAYLFSSGVIFMYGLPYGTLLYSQGRMMEIAFNALLFILAFLIARYAVDLTSFALGGLVVMFILKLIGEKHAILNWFRSF